MYVTGVATMKMVRKPANLLDMQFISEIKSTIEELGEHKDCRGLILTSVCI